MCPTCPVHEVFPSGLACEKCCCCCCKQLLTYSVRVSSMMSIPVPGVQWVRPGRVRQPEWSGQSPVQAGEVHRWGQAWRDDPLRQDQSLSSLGRPERCCTGECVRQCVCGRWLYIYQCLCVWWTMLQSFITSEMSHVQTFNMRIVLTRKKYVCVCSRTCVPLPQHTNARIY